jgi:alkylhydroperoxidase family enzyme
MAAHCTFAEMEGAPEEALLALRSGELPLGAPRLSALAAFTRQVVRRRGFVAAADVAAFEAAGFGRGQVLETLAVIGMTSLANWTHNLAGAPVDDAFRAHAWTAPGAAGAVSA